MADGRGYRHLCEIASGGMGRVYVAVRRDDPGRTLFAVKRLHAHLRDDPRARRTLSSESRLAGNVQHPNVLQVLESGEDIDGPFLAMQYVDGCSLAELYGAVKWTDEEFPIQICLNLIQQIAEGLHAIHEQAGGLLVVHRDVSPHNILIDFLGVVRIADFGIAKRLDDISSGDETSTGVLKGKVGYMSPEQLRFETPDRRSDLFAAGVILWELLAGRRLYQGSEGLEGARRILHEPPPDIDDERQDVPPEVVQLLFELLAKEPSTRPPTSQLVADRLRLSLDVLVDTEGPISLGDYTASFFEQRRRQREAKIAQALERSAAMDDAETVLGRAASEPRRRAWRVKGAAIKATIEYLQATYGEEGYARVAELCPEAIRVALQGPILVSSWYPGEMMVDLTESAQGLFGRAGEPQVALRMGASSADFALGDGGPYEVFRRQGLRLGVGPFLESSAEIYRLYYDVGTWRVQEVTDTAAIMRIEDGGVFPDAVAERIEGYLHRGLELLGCEDVQAKRITDVDDLLFSARWRQPRLSWPP